MKTLTLCLACLISSAHTYSSWKLVHSEKGIKVFAGKHRKSGVIPFKAIGTIHASVSEVAEVIEDDKLKPLWSPKLKEVIIHERLNENEVVFSEYYKTPWPSTDREFLIRGQILRHSSKDIEYIGKSVNHANRDDDHIQADVKMLNFRLKELRPNQTQITFVFNGDMKGWMPTWLMNMIQKKWPLRFIQGLRKQVSIQ